MRALTDNKEQVEVDGETLREIISSLEDQFPGLRDRVLEDDRIKPGLAVSINGEITNDGLRTRIGPSDEVHFVAAVSGGA